MSKKLLSLISLIVIALGLTCCKTGTFASEGGKDDIAYISVISSSEYANKAVTVSIDDTTTFDAKVRLAKQSTEKRHGDLYGIKPGKRHIKITYQGMVLYEKDIFVSSQQTKTIQL